jgi:hypothetical protein
MCSVEPSALCSVPPVWVWLAPLAHTPPERRRRHLPRASTTLCDGIVSVSSRPSATRITRQVCVDSFPRVECAYDVGAYLSGDALWTRSRQQPLAERLACRGHACARACPRPRAAAHASTPLRRLLPPNCLWPTLPTDAKMFMQLYGLCDRASTARSAVPEGGRAGAAHLGPPAGPESGDGCRHDRLREW